MTTVTQPLAVPQADPLAGYPTHTLAGIRYGFDADPYRDADPRIVAVLADAGEFLHENDGPATDERAQQVASEQVERFRCAFLHAAEDDYIGREEG